VIAIENVRGTVFYSEYLNNQKEYWAYTVDALVRAIHCFGNGRHSIVRHQGFNYKSREKLKSSLADSGHSFEIQSGSEKRAEIRLADGLAGYLGLVKHSGSATADHYPNVPDWFMDLKHEAPL
jgi:hypothetical protein